MVRKRAALVSLLMVPTLALAHGEDILVTIYAELLTVVAIVLALRLVPSFRRSRLGGTIFCIIGVIASWLVTSDMPYTDNQTLITTISVVLPLVATSVYLVWRHNRGVR